MTRGRTHWDAREDARLRALWPTEPNVRTIARHLGRSELSVRARARRLGLEVDDIHATPGRPWTAGERARLAVLWRGLAPMEAIVAELGRTEAGIWDQAKRLGLMRRYTRHGRVYRKRDDAEKPKATPRPGRAAADGPAKRRCLGGCGRMFQSDGFGNRRCKRCTDRQRSEHAVCDRAEAAVGL